MKKYIKFTFSIIVFVILTLFFNTCNNLKREKQERKIDKIIYNNNIKALSDTLTVLFDKKLQQFTTEKTSYVLNDIKELKQTNEELYKEFKDVKKYDYWN